MDAKLDQDGGASTSKRRLPGLRKAIRVLFWSTIGGTGAVVVACIVWVMYWESRVGGDNTATLIQAGELVSDSQRAFAAEPNRWQAVEDLTSDYEKAQSRFRSSHPAPESSEGYAPRDWTPDASVTYELKSSPAQRETAEKFLDALVQSGLLARQGLLTQARRFERPIDGALLIDLTYPDLKLARGLARADRALLLRYWKEGGAKDLEAAKTFEWLLALGRVYRYQFGAINSLVGIAIQALALNTIREVCVVRPLNEAALEYCLRAMDRQLDAPNGDFALQCERAMVLDAIQSTFTDDGQGDGYFLAAENINLGVITGGKSRRTSTGEGFFLAGKKELVAKFEELLKPDLERATTPPRDRVQGPIRETVDDLSWRFRILKILAPTVNKLIAAHDQLLGEIAGTRAMLAIELFRSRNGSLPKSLSELVPQYLAAEASDPLSPGILRFRLQDASTDPLGRGYLLYTVGFDRVDNEARINEKAPYTPMNGAKAGHGFDFVFNALDPDVRAFLESASKK